MHPTKPLQPENPWISSHMNAKPYIPKLTDITKLSHFQYRATSLINYGTYTDNMFALKIFAYAFCRQLVKVVTSKAPPTTDP